MLGNLLGAGLGIASSFIGGKKAEKAAAASEARALAAQREAALQQQQWAKENSIWANDQNITNAGLENTANRENIGWANDLNRGNQEWTQGMNRENIGWSNDLNKGNQEWAKGINDQSLTEQLGRNRIGQSNAFGSTLGYDEEGNQVQKFGTADQATLDALRGKRNDMIGGMDSEFNMNNSVYGARKANMDQDLATRRGQQEARLAAMGLSTGSGSAWANAQRSLGDTETRAQNELISGSVNDWNTEQGNLRNNVTSLGGVEDNLRGNLGQADYWKAGANNVAAPNAGTVTTTMGGVSGPTYDIPGVSAPGTSSYDPTKAAAAGNAAGEGVQNSWDAMGSGAGKAAEAGINWFNKPGDNGSPTGGGIVGGASQGSTGLGTFNPMAGFQTDPWSGASR